MSVVDRNNFIIMVINKIYKVYFYCMINVFFINHIDIGDNI